MGCPCSSELPLPLEKLETPALLFEDIPGIKKGYRVLFHELITPWAAAILNKDLVGCSEWAWNASITTSSGWTASTNSHTLVLTQLNFAS